MSVMETLALLGVVISLFQLIAVVVFGVLGIVIDLIAIFYNRK